MKYDLLHDDLINICKTASVSDLEDLCEQIRVFLVEKVSKTGGHLASNLGIVELSVALMRVFDSPRDRIIYDVGHQSYVHKILTGRAAGFDTLRQYGGMSGFPKSRESVHDAYDTGHSSTSVSAAYGMAVARDISGDDYNVIAVIGIEVGPEDQFGMRHAVIPVKGKQAVKVSELLFNSVDHAHAVPQKQDHPCFRECAAEGFQYLLIRHVTFDEQNIIVIS